MKLNQFIEQETGIALGDTVYHSVTGDKGLVISYKIYSDRVGPVYEILVSFGPGQLQHCQPIELSDTPIFN